MTTSHQERITVTTLFTVAILVMAVLLMITGVFGLADDMAFAKGFEVFSEIMVLGMFVIGYWFGKRSGT